MRARKAREKGKYVRNVRHANKMKARKACRKRETCKRQRHEDTQPRKARNAM